MVKRERYYGRLPNIFILGILKRTNLPKSLKFYSAGIQDKNHEKGVCHETQAPHPRRRAAGRVAAHPKIKEVFVDGKPYAEVM